ncbi:MAG: hypothetical protein ACYSTT_11935 [Planctomycetota bacterium]
MVSRKVVFLFLVAGVCISAMLLCYAVAKQNQAITAQPLEDRNYQSQEAMQQGKVPKRHTKITVPADVSIDLSETSNPGGPVTFLISASSQIPVGSGVVTLKVPPVGEIPAETLVLWSAAPSDFVAESAEYVIDALPAGEYRFAAIFEFTPDREDAEKLFASKTLYLDVRPDKILSSNVSFDQIKRIELWEELEQRVRMELRTSSRSISLQAAKPLDKDFIASRIAELRTSDPDVARRIMELNRVKTATAGESESAEQGEQSQKDLQRIRLLSRPVSERAVPIPDRYRDL